MALDQAVWQRGQQACMALQETPVSARMFGLAPQSNAIAHFSWRWTPTGSCTQGRQLALRDRPGGDGPRGDLPRRRAQSAGGAGGNKRAETAKRRWGCSAVVQATCSTRPRQFGGKAESKRNLHGKAIQMRTLAGRGRGPPPRPISAGQFHTQREFTAGPRRAFEEEYRRRDEPRQPRERASTDRLELERLEEGAPVGRERSYGVAEGATDDRSRGPDGDKRSGMPGTSAGRDVRGASREDRRGQTSVVKGGGGREDEDLVMAAYEGRLSGGGAVLPGRGASGGRGRGEGGSRASAGLDPSVQRALVPPELQHLMPRR